MQDVKLVNTKLAYEDLLGLSVSVLCMHNVEVQEGAVLIVRRCEAKALLTCGVMGVLSTMTYTRWTIKVQLFWSRYEAR